MRHVAGPTRLVIAGPPAHAGVADQLRELVRQHSLEDRVTLDLDFLPREKLADYVNHALACAYLPIDEDAPGYVTMEAFHAGKAVITTTDAGGVLDLVRDGETGWVVSPVGRGDCRCDRAGVRRSRERRAAGRGGPRLSLVPESLVGADHRKARVMRIAWYAPSHPRSAIGRFSRYVVGALRDAGHEVALLPADAVAEAPPSPAFDPAKVDIVVYNLGDNHAFHAGALNALRINPGVVILHDAYVLNLFLAQPQFLADRAGADALMDELHGPGTAAAVRAALVGADFLAETAPFTDDGVAGAAG